MRPSRGKVWLYLTADDEVGKPLAEWGYRTPRFPMGIKESDLAEAPSSIRQETMITWFLMNHVPANGPYFGFAEATGIPSEGKLNARDFSGLSPTSGIRITGFNQGGFFSGGTALELLKREFGNTFDEQFILVVSSPFEGLWTPLPDVPLLDLETQAPEQWPATLTQTLNAFTETIRTLSPQHGGIGHNEPPDEAILTREDERIILKASADARIAVQSSDYSTAHLAWVSAKPIFDKIAAAVSRHIDAFFNKFAITLGTTMALVVTGYIGKLLGIWNGAQAITGMLELAKNILP